MNIAILGIKALPASAGADRVVEKLLENFGSEHDYWIYIRKDTPNAATCHDNLHFIHVPALAGKHLGSFSFFFMCCVHYLLKGRYDLAHVHNSDFGLFVPLLRLKFGVPVLGTFHGDPFLRDKWGRMARAYLRISERAFVSFCHRLTSVSRFKDDVRGFFGKRRVSYIPNGVDPYGSEDTGAFDFRAFGLRRGEYLLFACGRLDPTKGLHHLLAAYQTLSDRPPLFIVGDFAHDAAYSARVNALIGSMPEVTAHRGLLDRATLLDAVRGCRIFVFPSEVEAMSMMLLEAVSCRRPVVTSDIPENVEVVGEDHRWSYPTFDEAALAATLREALASPVLDSEAAALSERALARFDWKRIARSYQEIYSEMRR